MATWSVKPLWKKSVIERQEMIKDGNTFIIETGWRWGEFHVYTEDDNPPELLPGVDIFDCGYDSELVETNDGCWDEYDFDECDEETVEWLQNFFDEGNSVFDLEEHGWTCGDTEMIIDCEMDIEMIEPTGEVEEPTPETEAKAKWPNT